MKFAVSSALAAIASANWPVGKEPDNLPSGECLVWPVTSKTCIAQWDQFDSYCDRLWDLSCEAVDEEWYSQDLSFVEPQWPDEDCFTTDMNKDCEEQWSSLNA